MECLFSQHEIRKFKCLKCLTDKSMFTKNTIQIKHKLINQGKVNQEGKIESDLENTLQQIIATKQR